MMRVDSAGVWFRKSPDDFKLSVYFNLPCIEYNTLPSTLVYVYFLLERYTV